MEDVDGNVFLDVNAGIAVTSTGHCHPTVVEAIQRQAAELIHYSASDFYLPIYSELAERLEEVAPMSGPVRSFLTNSGTEAVEAGIKLARWSTGRQYVIAFYGSFHGRSYGSVSLTASKVNYRAGFGPLLPGVVHAYYGDGRDMPVPPRGDEAGFPTIDHIEGFLMKKIVAPEEVAAIVVEPVLGEGGYIVPPEGWLQALRDLCDRHGILLIADEVQSGMGRTGKMWAVEHTGVEPDILLSGKGIASGMPLGAMIAKDSVMTWTKGTHGSTYGGNPLSCAAAIATLDVIKQEELLENTAKVGELLVNGLLDIQSRHDAIREVRGLGTDDRHRAARSRHGGRGRTRRVRPRPADARVRRGLDPDVPGAGVPRGPGARRPRAVRRGRRRDRSRGVAPPWHRSSSPSRSTAPIRAG